MITSIQSPIFAARMTAIRNVALSPTSIMAKPLVDKILHYCGCFPNQRSTGDLILDNNDLEGTGNYHSFQNVSVLYKG